METEDRRAILENDADTKPAQVGHGGGRRKKSRTGEMVATSTAHVRPD